MTPETVSTIVLLGSFFVMIFLRFPIAYSVGISTVLFGPCDRRNRRTDRG